MYSIRDIVYSTEKAHADCPAYSPRALATSTLDSVSPPFQLPAGVYPPLTSTAMPLAYIPLTSRGYSIQVDGGSIRTIRVYGASSTRMVYSAEKVNADCPGQAEHCQQEHHSQCRLY